MPTKHNIGSRIRSFREEREIDLEALSQDTNLSVEFLNQLENGEIYPSIGPMQKLARALGVRLGTFLDDQYTRDPIIGRIGGEGGDPALHTAHGPAHLCLSCAGQGQERPQHGALLH